MVAPLYVGHQAVKLYEVCHGAGSLGLPDWVGWAEVGFQLGAKEVPMVDPGRWGRVKQSGFKPTEGWAH